MPQLKAIHTHCNACKKKLCAVAWLYCHRCGLHTHHIRAGSRVRCLGCATVHKATPATLTKMRRMHITNHP